MRQSSVVLLPFVAFALLHPAGAAASPPRPILVTVDDLPIAADTLHPDPAERERITRDMLRVLAKHGITAVGLVAGKHHPAPADERLLELWLRGGHELGNHSFGHPNYTQTEIAPYIADLEKERAWLADFLAAHGSRLRFFRFPFLNEGDTPEKVRAARDYLKASGQTNLPVTLDNQDWSYEDRWVAARQAGEDASLARVAEDYQAAIRIHVEQFESRGERLFGRPTPEILLLHAGEVGAAQWDALFTWLEGTNHRFATADEVLADPAYSTPYAYIAENGVSLWERLKAERRKSEAPPALRRALDAQVAAWNRGDLEAFVAIYAEDVTFISPGGVAHGRQGVLERYRRKYPDREAMGTLSLEVFETRLLAGEEFTFFGDTVVGRMQGATLAARWTLTYEGKPPLTGSTLLILRPRGEAWEIIQDASM
jgi:uncharacterized protein (TIGR02246 family)